MFQQNYFDGPTKCSKILDQQTRLFRVCTISITISSMIKKFWYI